VFNGNQKCSPDAVWKKLSPLILAHCANKRMAVKWRGFVIVLGGRKKPGFKNGFSSIFRRLAVGYPKLKSKL
jgi:hypothetical protein